MSTTLSFPSIISVDNRDWQLQNLVRYQVSMCLISEMAESKAHHPNRNAQIRKSWIIIRSSPKEPSVFRKSEKLRRERLEKQIGFKSPFKT